MWFQGWPGGVLGDADQQEGEPAEDDVGADAVLAAVVDGAQVDDLLHVAPAAVHFQELLVAERDVLGGHVGVGAAQQVLAVEVLLGADPGLVDAEEAGGGDAQEPLQPGASNREPSVFPRSAAVRLSVPAMSSSSCATSRARMAASRSAWSGL